jgi:plasmid stabilization system protein ParE
MKIQYDIEARRQIGEIFKYGKVKFGTQIALKYKEKLREKINTLKQNPLIGNIEWMLTDEEHEYRFLLVKPYKIIYSVKGDIIRIHLFWHIHRNPDILKDYQDKIFQKIEKAEINKEQAKEKETKQEKEKNHISNIETQEQKPELTRFEQAKLNREAKQGQEQEQEKKRGFRR